MLGYAAKSCGNEETEWFDPSIVIGVSTRGYITPAL
jgi:hypothetical protein